MPPVTLYKSMSPDKRGFDVFRVAEGRNPERDSEVLLEAIAAGNIAMAEVVEMSDEELRELKGALASRTLDVREQDA